MATEGGREVDRPPSVPVSPSRDSRQRKLGEVVELLLGRGRGRGRGQVADCELLGRRMPMP